MPRSKGAVTIRKIENASKVIRSATGLIRHVSALLRQLVTLMGWMILLVGAVRILAAGPDQLSMLHFLLPGTGAAAIIQGLIRPRTPAVKELQKGASPPQP